MNKYLAVYGKPRFLGILSVPDDQKIENYASIIVESQRGTEAAVLIAPLTEDQEAVYRKIRTASEHSEGMTRGGELAVTDLEFIRLSDDNIELEQHNLRLEEEMILKKSKELLSPHQLDMKLIDVELFLDRKKLFFYFTSEQRVDFRAFVRDLAREFKTRIELRQVGVRDEAKIIKGLASCGRECCCSYWLNQFSPICIRMVKEQNLALNPTKISGICGRLMCCMCYEHNVYKELWSHLPNPGSKFATPLGNVVLQGVDLRKKAARCYIPGTGEVLVPIEQFKDFKETLMSGQEWILQTEETNTTVITISPNSDFVEKKRTRDPKPIVSNTKNRNTPKTSNNEKKHKHQEQLQIEGRENPEKTPRKTKSRRRRAPKPEVQLESLKERSHEQRIQPAAHSDNNTDVKATPTRRRRKRPRRKNQPDSETNPSGTTH